MAVSVPTVKEVNAVAGRGPHALTFGPEDMRSLGGPMVYGWARGDQILYVGLSRYGVQRPFAGKHHRLRGMEAGDRLLVWCWDLPEEAEHFERQIILKLRPPLNDSPVVRAPDRARRLRRSPAINEMLEPKFMAPEEVWTTVEETARLLYRSPKTIRNLISEHGLRRRIIREGKTNRRIMLLSHRARAQLRKLCWGAEAPNPDC